MNDNKSTWEFGTRQVVYGAIGAALYGVLSWVTNVGAAYGPWVGLLAGLIGNTLGDLFTGWGLYWNWSVGNGLMGMIPGLIVASIRDFRARADIIKAVGWGTLGIIVGMLFASLSEMFTGGIDFSTALVGYFVPAFLGNFVVTVILLPILMIAFAAVVARRGR
jgi:energy-coupling factor transport system substrate-specific component